MKKRTIEAQMGAFVVAQQFGSLGMVWEVTDTEVMVLSVTNEVKKFSIADFEQKVKIGTFRLKQ